MKEPFHHSALPKTMLRQVKVVIHFWYKLLLNDEESKQFPNTVEQNIYSHSYIRKRSHPLDIHLDRALSKVSHQPNTLC